MTGRLTKRLGICCAITGGVQRHSPGGENHPEFQRERPVTQGGPKLYLDTFRVNECVCPCVPFPLGRASRSSLETHSCLIVAVRKLHRSFVGSPWLCQGLRCLRMTKPSSAVISIGVHGLARESVDGPKDLVFACATDLACIAVPSHLQTQGPSTPRDHPSDAHAPLGMTK
jgi:hypothetical protein